MLRKCLGGRKKPSPDAIEFHPSGPIAVSLTDLRIQKKDHRP
jgi:hypothetical protein